jgi:hypothetical protein
MTGRTWLIALLAWATTAGAAAAQDVTLAITHAGCGSAAPPLVAPPRNKEERERVTATWIAADRLRVDVWDDETAEDVIDGDSATVTLAGDTLTLSYAHRRAPTHAQARMPACLFAAKLSFVVSGIARASYRVHVDGHEVVVVDG